MAVGLTEAIKRRRFYDGKQLWEEYHSWGRASSHRKLREWAVKKGMANPTSGKVSQMGPYFAMWRYALRNPKEAYPAYEKYAQEFKPEIMAAGLEINFHTFLVDIQLHAKAGGVVARGTYEEFCRKWGLDIEPKIDAFLPMSEDKTPEFSETETEPTRTE